MWFCDSIGHSKFLGQAQSLRHVSPFTFPCEKVESGHETIRLIPRTKIFKWAWEWGYLYDHLRLPTNGHTSPRRPSVQPSPPGVAQTCSSVAPASVGPCVQLHTVRAPPPPRSSGDYGTCHTLMGEWSDGSPGWISGGGGEENSTLCSLQIPNLPIIIGANLLPKSHTNKKAPIDRKAFKHGVVWFWYSWALKLQNLQPPCYVVKITTV